MKQVYQNQALKLSSNMAQTALKAQTAQTAHTTNTARGKFSLIIVDRYHINLNH